MWKRIIWDMLCLGMVFFAPWWVTLVLGIIGVIIFPWYVEVIIMGTLYDVFFGGVTGSWIYQMIHTLWFTVPLLIIEFIKPYINTR